MKKNLFVMICLAALTNCTAFDNKGYNYESEVKMNPPPQTAVEKSDYVVETNYELNDVKVAGVDDTVVRVIMFNRNNYLHARMVADQKIVMKTQYGEEAVIKKGASNIFGQVTIKGENYYTFDAGSNIYMLADSMGYIQNTYLYKLKGNNYQIIGGRVLLKPNQPKLRWERSSEVAKIPVKDFEIDFQGIANGNMKFFVKYAVPGTNGEDGSFKTLAFPKDQTMISIEGIMIRVLRVDRTQIEYTVIKNAW